MFSVPDLCPVPMSCDLRDVTLIIWIEVVLRQEKLVLN